MEKISEVKCFEGRQLRYLHTSDTLHCDMHFSIFLPPGASKNSPVPIIYWLSGLTCTDENFVQKAGAQAYAAKHNVAIVTPDTSPRGESVPDDEDASWDFGLGAGFYVDAQKKPWSQHYNMYSYIVSELPILIESEFPVTSKKSIMGHSMGGHGALTIALKNPNTYSCVTAFSPICAPSECPWGKKALTHYLGGDENLWEEYDACRLIAKGKHKIPLWVEQGGGDNFLAEQLLPHKLQQACKAHNHPLHYELREGYDHSYFFIASFIEKHIKHHASILNS